MNNLIVFDFEVFKYDTLLGCYIIDPEKFEILDTLQTWDQNTIRDFYQDHQSNSIWIGHNNKGYDNLILQAVVDHKNPKLVSDQIVKEHNRYLKLHIPLYYYDLMVMKNAALKTFEAFEGKNISETTVSFDLERCLTKEEKIEVESYNRDDLDQTFSNLKGLRDNFELRLTLLNKFNLPLTDLCSSEAELAAKILGAKPIEGIDQMDTDPVLYDNLKIKNQTAIDFYLSKDWNRSVYVELCGTKNKLARGGIHGAIKKSYFDEALYIDVSGYYNLIMIKLGLLPRTIPKRGQEIYEDLFYQQLKMKKTNPRMRAVFKVILLAVSGSMMNQYTNFYDPSHGELMRLSGQMFIVDLLEKLEGKVKLIQSNTDGIIVKPLEGVEESEVIEIVNEWMDRTGFKAKIDKIYHITQRDVNNYMYLTSDGKVEVRGEAVKHYGGIVSPFATNGYNSVESLIIPQCVVDFFIYDKSPEKTIEENKDNLRMFQYICKQGTFDYVEYEKTDLETGETTVERIQKVNRAFAYNSTTEKGMIYKRKFSGKKNKVSSIPSNVFVYNNEINSPETVKKLQKMIDYDFYLKRAYESILEFMDEQTS